MLWIIHHWWIPIIGALTWFGMLWAMLGVWLAKGRPQYPWQDGPIALISDIGATGLQPLFIAGSSVMGACFILAVASDRLLRHQSRLPRNMRETERVLSYLAITGATIGAAGIILVACFNTNLHPSMHRGFLLMFIVGVALSAIFTTVEYRYLDRHHIDHQTQHGLLRASYIFKIVIVTIEIACAIAFGITLYKRIHNSSAILEWLISFLFTFYLLSFAIDLWPAATATKGDYAIDGHGLHGNGNPAMGTAPAMGDGYNRAGYANGGGFANGYNAHGGVHPDVELGRTGGATAFATGEDARHMRQVESRDTAGTYGGGAPVAMQNYDENGYPQRTTRAY